MANPRWTVQNDMTILLHLVEMNYAATEALTAADRLHDLLESEAARWDFFHRARLEMLDVTEKLRELQERIQEQRTDHAGRVRHAISEGIFPLGISERTFPVPPPAVPRAASQTASPRDAVPGLEISRQAEVDQVSNFLRNVTDGDGSKSDRLRALELLFRPTPASGEALTAMTRMWEEARANHPGPSVLESVLLPEPAPESSGGPTA